jgi:N-acyl-D-amino-acid deacylase
VTLFDPLTVVDTASFTDPHQRPQGIPWVLVNGQPVIADGKHTGARPGQMVK